MNTKKSRAYLSLTILALLAMPACRNLDPAGVYGGDKILYDADLAIATSYDTIHQFVLWEFSNREALSSIPEIKKYADTVRRNAPQWFSSAISVRDAYKLAPTSENQAALAKAVATIRAALVEITRYYVRAGPALGPIRQP
jgi:hypothetical protein